MMRNMVSLSRTSGSCRWRSNSSLGRDASPSVRTARQSARSTSAIFTSLGSSFDVVNRQPMLVQAQCVSQWSVSMSQVAWKSTPSEFLAGTTLT